MNSLYLQILPVYSEFDPIEHIGGRRLMKHQVETLEAFNDPYVDVIFNTAMTGDGKSLVAYLPVFQQHKHIIAMYPTNELVQDQNNALSGYRRRLDIHLPRYDTMYSDKISQLMQEHNSTVRLEEVRKLLEKNSIVLTNPDLIHLMMSHQYGWDHLRKELPVTIGAYYDYFLFDEFHVFGVPQVISVMNMLGYLTVNYREKPADRKKFVFLSATPSKLMNNLLERGSLRYKKIEGSYKSFELPNYRRILQACTLELHEISQETPTESWIEERLEEIYSFFKQNNGSKAAILVYSVATARRLFARLKEYFEPLGISVGENTGLTHREGRRASFEKDILVGTSTVDIGVDFHINYLIFEAFNAGSFLQRFGRLGRHDEFGTYQAYALIPRFVLERLTQVLDGKEGVERDKFNVVVREAFPTEQEYVHYTQRWGIVQAAQILAELQGQSNKDENRALTDALAEQYERFYGTSDKTVMSHAVKKYWAFHNNAPQILDQLQSFRGQSPLSCGIWDTDDQLKTYELFFLLANTEFDVMSAASFLQEVRKRGFEERDFKEQLLYLKILKYVPERMQLVLGLQCDLEENAGMIHHVAVSDNFFVHEPRSTRLDQVNRNLKRLKLTCVLSDIPRTELKQRLNLSSMFPVYRLLDRTGNEYSVVFGQEALLLESLLFYRKAKGDKPMMY